MIDLRKLVGTAHAPTEITVDGVKFTGANSASGFRPNKIEFTPDALVKLVEARVRELGVSKEHTVTVTFETKSVDYGDGSDFGGAVVTFKHESADGR